MKKQANHYSSEHLYDVSSLISKEIQEMLGFDHFPYKTKLSFAPLINHWKKELTSPEKDKAVLAEIIIKELDNALEFQTPIEDFSLIKKHKGFVDLLMAGLLPPLVRDKQYVRASAPFSMDGFYHSPALNQLIKEGNLEFCVDKPTRMIFSGAVIKAGGHILNTFYGQNVEMQEPFIFTAQANKSGVERHFKAEFNMDFVEIKKLKPLKQLRQNEINQLFSNIYDIDVWLEYLPPQNFEFHGLVTFRLVDITEEETLSRLKHVLLEKDAVVYSENIKALEKIIKAYFHMPELRLGITALDYPVENAVQHKYRIRHDFLAKEFPVLLDPATSDSIYERACKMREMLIIEDIHNISPHTAIETTLIEKNFRSIIIAPLKNKHNNIIGLLEIGSPRGYELNSLVALKMQEIVPLFRTALERSRDEIDNAIEVVIREQYTAIHPSVDWKFIEKAYNLLEKREQEGTNAKIEPIIFNDVYPLYGQSDIVGSSTKRNDAIQADLLDNLSQIQTVLQIIVNEIFYPIADNFILRIGDEMAHLKEGINSNDEYRVLEFIQKEIHPLFEHIRNKNDKISSAVAKYFNYLDPDLKTVYRQRKDYEHSVMMVNDALSSYLAEQNRLAQDILPHYFEKYQTDGVEYDIYVGSSMLKKEKFRTIHLKNLRLWQLIVMCGITRIVEEIRPTMPMPLHTAQLVLVHSTPLAIRFRMDEKQFDVDGAYNIRYAIIKKRIDKALIEGTNERLTVSGKVAIVYADEHDRAEYMEYINYLLNKGYITDNVEDLHLQKMQGVQGMKALRITVKIPKAELIATQNGKVKPNGKLKLAALSKRVL